MTALVTRPRYVSYELATGMVVLPHWPFKQLTHSVERSPVFTTSSNLSQWLGTRS